MSATEEHSAFRNDLDPCCFFHIYFAVEFRMKRTILPISLHSIAINNKVKTCLEIVSIYITNHKLSLALAIEMAPVAELLKTLFFVFPWQFPLGLMMTGGCARQRDRSGKTNCGT